MDEDGKTGDQRRAEAAQWFARLKTLPVSQGTLRDFFAWRKDTQNAQAFEEAERFWTEAGKVGESPAILRAIDAAQARTGAHRRLLRPVSIAAMLAAVAVLVTAGLLYMSSHRSEISTDIGELRLVALDDGSRVQLNAGTRLDVRFANAQRKLVLHDGEALFRVSHDSKRPFSVVAGDVTVTATGTQFDVSRMREKTTVTLLEGSVTVRGPDGRIYPLRPGEQWRWPVDGSLVRAVNPANVVAWVEGRIVFDDIALADAVATVNRHGGVPVALDAPAQAQSRISGTFETGDSQAFAVAVTALLPLQTRKDSSGTIHLVPTAPNSTEITRRR